MRYMKEIIADTRLSFTSKVCIVVLLYIYQIPFSYIRALINFHEFVSGWPRVEFLTPRSSLMKCVLRLSSSARTTYDQYFLSSRGFNCLNSLVADKWRFLLWTIWYAVTSSFLVAFVDWMGTMISGLHMLKYLVVCFAYWTTYDLSWLCVVVGLLVDGRIVVGFANWICLVGLK